MTTTTTKLVVKAAQQAVLALVLALVLVREPAPALGPVAVHTRLRECQRRQASLVAPVVKMTATTMMTTEFTSRRRNGSTAALWALVTSRQL